MFKVTISKVAKQQPVIFKNYDPSNVVLVWRDPQTGKETRLVGVDVAWCSSSGLSVGYSK